MSKTDTQGQGHVTGRGQGQETEKDQGHMRKAQGLEDSVA